MSYSIYPTPDFKKFFKNLYKKYPSLKTDLQEFVEKLSKEPITGIPTLDIIFIKSGWL